MCKSFLKNFGILTPEAILIKKGEKPDINLILEKVGLPCFVKPNNGGSSFGISKVNKVEELEQSVTTALKEDSEVIVESFVKGTELSVGMFKTRQEELVFPVTEIISGNDFFDFEAKYTEGKSQEITPATVPDDIQKKAKLVASDIYNHLNCRGIVRIDFILRGNQIYFLELNSVPGMSKESIVPKQIRAMGLTVQEVLEKIIEDTLV